MVKLKIRALTLHISVPQGIKESELEKLLSDKTNLLLNSAEKLEAETGIEVWSARISLHSMQDNLIDEAIATLKKYPNVRAMIYERKVSEMDIDLLKKVTKEGMYAAIKVEHHGELEKLARAIERVSEENPEHATRFAAELSGESLETAYFPLSLHGGGKEDKFTLALLYPNDAMLIPEEIAKSLEIVLEKFYEKISLFLKEGLLGTKISGIDYSLSPWMEESVAKLIQEKGKCRLERAGCLGEVWEVNRVLQGIARKRMGIGFNEVMLPLSEDDELKSLVSQGKLGIRDFLLYSSVCVAGLDMIPLSTSSRELREILQAAYAIARTKQRPYGVRLILVKNADGKVRLGGFGDVPVLVKY
ncbi:MAG: DUF711 family protein [Fervidicoccaceae archaeon]